MSSSTEPLRRYIPIPSEYQIYNSYAEDPKWQKKFTIIWTSFLAFSLLLSIPYIIHHFRIGRLYSGLAIRESLDPSQDVSNSSHGNAKRNHSQNKWRATFIGRAVIGVGAMVQSITLWTLPMPDLSWLKGEVGDCCRRAYFTLSISQIILVMGYAGAVIACFVVGANLTQNSNRPGFLALSQLPLIVLLSLKSPLPLPIFVPSLSYEHYNFLHRWTGRTLFLSATVHGAMWIHQFLVTDQHDQITAAKSKRGILAYALMGMVVITSLRPIRRKCYQLFWMAHIMFFVGFFAALSYHTPYSRPWIWPCVAIYAYDLIVRMLRYRIKDATLVPVDKTLTMIHIPDCDAGWLPTQHILLRVLSGSGIFESHPFTITNAPSTAFSASPRGIILYAKVAGDWTRKLHALARDVKSLEVGDDLEEKESFLANKAQSEGGGNVDEEGIDHPGKRVQVMIDGPYGGLSMDLGQYESVLLVGGGSGITFILGSIEEALRVREKGRGPAKVDVAWVVKDLCTIEALAPSLLHLYTLAQRLSLALTYNLYLTNPPHPLPPTPSLLPASTTLSPYRPEVAQLVRESLPLPLTKTQGASLEQGRELLTGGDDGHQVQHHGEGRGHAGGLAVVACGPEGIVMEAKNAVAGLGIAERVRCGGVGFHGECYVL
ncbi:ferric-chelate reductase [Cryptococcus neoformans C23]|uniref:Ferric-chelate reductase n=2 Tax=Cryptococcus neoformans TaxID=5207 RepID=A0A854QMI5_CRYNE|nr:ferric-chelate reductase [Cryptococcus neoformans var. grubii H99]AUB21771.1 ferric-chelate reductase [Cryptococcus neoformans var. grubii]OWZ36936.1 ferric-chelate reductase [Cryptococcus neoformans var. grubii AD2-60a]OWZ48767.1 ferric-chelate reductase [Cryptococcus neoformans var. grubii C23]OWZ58929.1 ferric-chelate reductase [Cryptococcus neoformans var. grubii AD1-83a]OXC87482.1 ferric-chelate reductase [Cryptococcus neoformans var. grubii AD1-7a]OXG30125.1 ferric-chelate reductase |eukprot:XP_012047038.1 ferric-chelate reductase [Cryptococcus neoformans var. grubii H99]